MYSFILSSFYLFILVAFGSSVFQLQTFVKSAWGCFFYTDLSLFLRAVLIHNPQHPRHLTSSIGYMVDAEPPPGIGGRRSLDCLRVALYALLGYPYVRTTANLWDHNRPPLPPIIYFIALQSLNRAKERLSSSGNKNTFAEVLSFEEAARVAGGSWVVPTKAILHSGPKSSDI